MRGEKQAVYAARISIQVMMNWRALSRPKMLISPTGLGPMGILTLMVTSALIEYGIYLSFLLSIMIFETLTHCSISHVIYVLTNG